MYVCARIKYISTERNKLVKFNYLKFYRTQSERGHTQQQSVFAQQHVIVLVYIFLTINGRTYSVYIWKYKAVYDTHAIWLPPSPSPSPVSNYSI